MKQSSKNILYETLFQIVLLGTVFIFYAFNRVNANIETEISPYEIAFFLNFAFAAFLINYFLLPKFLYRKKLVGFIALAVVLIGFTIIMEELVLEKIYFPTTRGAQFAGIFHTLLNMMPIIIILVGFKFGWDALTKQREVEQLRIAVKDSELQFLRSQINPHFLFNNLNNLYSYALEKSAKTPKIILELSAVLRYMLYECQAKFVPVNKEIDHLENFVNLSKLQLEGRSRVYFNAEKIETGYLIAPLILLVFVENAFKHSLSSVSDHIEILFDISLKEEELSFICENTYSLKSNTEALHGGIGLNNVKKRLELLYPKKHSLNIETKNDKFVVILTLKIHRN